MEDEITQLVHDRDLKALVTAMRPDAKTKFSEVAIGEVMRGKEESMLGQKRKQQVMDELLASLDKKTVESFKIASQKSGSKDLDSKIASFLL